MTINDKIYILQNIYFYLCLLYYITYPDIRLIVNIKLLQFSMICMNTTLLVYKIGNDTKVENNYVLD